MGAPKPGGGVVKDSIREIWSLVRHSITTLPESISVSRNPPCTIQPLCNGRVKDEMLTCSFLSKIVRLVLPSTRLNSCMSCMSPSSVKFTRPRTWYDVSSIIPAPSRLPDNRLSLPRINVKAGESWSVVSLKSHTLRFSTNLAPLQTSSYVATTYIWDRVRIITYSLLVVYVRPCLKWYILVLKSSGLQESVWR